MKIQIAMVLPPTQRFITELKEAEAKLLPFWKQYIQMDYPL